MIRTTDYKEKFIPMEKIGDEVYLVRWDFKPMTEKVYQKNEKDELVLDENQMPIPTGEVKDTPLATWMEEIFYYKPSESFIENMILDWYNKQIDRKILTEFKWNDIPVWLSQENQFNYKAAYDLAVQTQGKSLPITFKFGTQYEPVYKEFTTLEELTDFYTKAMKFINDTLAAGWQTKDTVNFSTYNL